MLQKILILFACKIDAGSAETGYMLQLDIFNSSSAVLHNMISSPSPFFFSFYSSYDGLWCQPSSRHSMETRTQFQALSALGSINTMRPGEQKAEEQVLLCSVCFTLHFSAMEGKEKDRFQRFLETKQGFWEKSLTFSSGIGGVQRLTTTMTMAVRTQRMSAK